MRINPRITETLAKVVLWGAAALSVFILFFIVVYILWKGLPVISLDFILKEPEHLGRTGGIFSTILGTIALTALAVLIATPLGVGTAIFLTEYTRETGLTKIIRFGVECLAGIPSIIFGLFGFIFFVIFLHLGWSILSGGLTVALMILPTIVRTSEESIKSVPRSYRETSFALGATKWQTVTRAVLPSAMPGIVTGIILGIGRCVGETAATIFTAGAALNLPTSIFSPIRTLAVHFYILAREGISMPMAYGTAAVLVIIILVINAVANWLMNRLISKVSV